MVARIIVLAAQRPGVVDPLAQRFGVSHKCLVPIAGVPLIDHVLRTVASHAVTADVMISVEPEIFDEVQGVIDRLPPGSRPVHCAASANNIADSVFAAARGHFGPIIITTADNALLTPDALDAVVKTLTHGADVAIAMAKRESVLAMHPDAQRRFYRFADASYSNCNLYAMAGPQALQGAEIFRGGGQFAKKAGRIIEAFGLINLILLRSGLISLPRALARISRRIDLTIAPIILSDGRNAIDVDNERTYAIVEGLISPRPQSSH
jgi:GTP:adenosylcobinamide-phosphate guanylyltransferase